MPCLLHRVEAQPLSVTVFGYVTDGDNRPNRTSCRLSRGRGRPPSTSSVPHRNGPHSNGKGKHMHGKTHRHKSGNRIYVDGTWFDTYGAACEPVDTPLTSFKRWTCWRLHVFEGRHVRGFAFGDTAVVHMGEPWYAMDGTPSFKRRRDRLATRRSLVARCSLGVLGRRGSMCSVGFSRCGKMPRSG